MFWRRFFFLRTVRRHPDISLRCVRAVLIPRGASVSPQGVCAILHGCHRPQIPTRKISKPASAPIASTPAALNPSAAQSFFSANSPLPIPVSRSIRASPSSPAPAITRKCSVDLQARFFLIPLHNIMVSYPWAHPSGNERSRATLPRYTPVHCPQQTPCASIRFVRRADQGILRFSFASLRFAGPNEGAALSFLRPIPTRRPAPESFRTDLARWRLV